MTVGTCRSSLLCLVVLAAPCVCAAQAPAAVDTSLSAYVERLDAIRSAVEASPADAPSRPLAALVDELPAVWRVNTSRQSFDISTGWLRRDIAAWRDKADPTVAARLVVQLRALVSESAGFERPFADPSDTRQQLSEILNRREFRNLRGPNWRDRLTQRVLEFVGGLLGRLFGMSAIPTIGGVLVYTLMALAVITVAVRAYQFFRRDAGVHSIRPDELPVSATPWRDWLATAQAAAAGQHWRDAVHAAYWCAVSFLETKGAWPPDRARTPREYLALLSNAHEHRSTLAMLTRRFERVWYGTDHADAVAFDEALTSLKKMGCLSA